MKSKSITRCMISVLILLLSAIPCYAGFGGSATPDFPAQVTKGAPNVAVGLDLVPFISGADTGPVILTQITLIPSCGNQTGTGICAIADADPGVFSVSASGTGAVACAGINFTIAQTDGATGQVTFTPDSPISLNSGQDCRINFTVNVIQLPSKDAGLAAGLQTAQEARFVILKDSVQVGVGTGSDLTTVLGCGDSVIQAPETCDPPLSVPTTPANNTNQCRNNCTYCGDGVLDAGEQCDDGNAVAGDGCSPTCLTEVPCGDGNLDAGETCDPPGSVPTTPSGNTNQCRATCTYCGDGIVNNGEQCDDGNAVAGDGCEPNCTVLTEAICRTPGYWQTHACAQGGCEKAEGKAQNITGGVLSECGGCLEVCGEIINDTWLMSADSTLEAMCVRPSADKDSPLQLVRQLTAMALNCCVSNFGPDCGGDANLDALFSDCNDTCIDESGTRSIGQCVEEVDCFNNGGQFYNMADSDCCEASGGMGCEVDFCEQSVCSYDLYCCTDEWDLKCADEAAADPYCGYCSDLCITGICSIDNLPCSDDLLCGLEQDCEAIPNNCHSMEIPFEDLGLDPNQTAAGSSKACNAANKNNCLVVGSGEQNCTSGTRSASPESCD